MVTNDAITTINDGIRTISGTMFLMQDINILEHTKTNVSPMEIVSLANKVIKTKNTKFDQMEFPLEGHREGKNLGKEKGWVIEWEKDYNIEALNKFIFDYENYINQ